MSGYFAHRYFTAGFFAGRYFPPLEDAETGASLVYSVYNGAPIGMLYPPGEKFQRPDRVFDDELVAMMTIALVA